MLLEIKTVHQALYESAFNFILKTESRNAPVIKIKWGQEICYDLSICMRKFNFVGEEGSFWCRILG